MSQQPHKSTAEITNPILADALKYAELGFDVGPWMLIGGDKVPLGRFGTGPKGKGKGFSDWSSDPKSVRKLFNGRDHYDGVGCLPGSAGFVVVDVDVKNGARGPEGLRDLVAGYGDDVAKIIETLTTQTPSGGSHFYLKAGGAIYGQNDNHAVNADGVKISGTGVDIRQSDGWVPLPPILGPDTGYSCTSDVPFNEAIKSDLVLDAPEWFSRAWPAKAAKDHSGSASSGDWNDTVRKFLAENNSGHFTDAALKNTYDADIASLRTLASGRHELVKKITGRLARHCGRRNVDAEDILKRTLAALSQSRSGENRDTKTELVDLFTSCVEKEVKSRPSKQIFDDLPVRATPIDSPVDEEIGDDSWALADLRLALSADLEHAEILVRTDGVALLYKGKINSIFGETESAKTWIAYLCAAEVLAAGGRVAILDYEDEANTCAQRLSALGVSVEVFAETDRVRFLHPPGPLERHRLAEWITWAPDLVIVDGVTAACEVEGISPNEGVEIARWMRSVLGPLARCGAAVAMLDHVTKSTEGRGSNPINSVHKKNGITGAAYTAEAIFPLSRAVIDPVNALVRLSIAKDRPGAVRAHAKGKVAPIADVHFTAYPDGGVSWMITPPGVKVRDDIRPKIIEHLTAYEGATKSALRSLGNHSAIDETLLLMINAGEVRIVASGNSHKHYLVPTIQKEAA